MLKKVLRRLNTKLERDRVDRKRQTRRRTSDKNAVKLTNTLAILQS